MLAGLLAVSCGGPGEGPRTHTNHDLGYKVAYPGRWQGNSDPRITQIILRSYLWVWADDEGDSDPEAAARALSIRFRAYMTANFEPIIDEGDLIIATDSLDGRIFLGWRGLATGEFTSSEVHVVSTGQRRIDGRGAYLVEAALSGPYGRTFPVLVLTVEDLDRGWIVFCRESILAQCRDVIDSFHIIKAVEV